MVPILAWRTDRPEVARGRPQGKAAGRGSVGRGLGTFRPCQPGHRSRRCQQVRCRNLCGFLRFRRGRGPGCHRGPERQGRDHQRGAGGLDQAAAKTRGRLGRTQHDAPRPQATASDRSRRRATASDRQRPTQNRTEQSRTELETQEGFSCHARKSACPGLESLIRRQGIRSIEILARRKNRFRGREISRSRPRGRAQAGRLGSRLAKMGDVAVSDARIHWRSATPRLS